MTLQTRPLQKLCQCLLCCITSSDWQLLTLSSLGSLLPCHRKSRNNRCEGNLSCQHRCAAWLCARLLAAHAVIQLPTHCNRGKRNLCLICSSLGKLARCAVQGIFLTLPSCHFCVSLVSCACSSTQEVREALLGKSSSPASLVQHDPCQAMGAVLQLDVSPGLAPPSLAQELGKSY